MCDLCVKRNKVANSLKMPKWYSEVTFLDACLELSPVETWLAPDYLEKVISCVDNFSIISGNYERPRGDYVVDHRLILMTALTNDVRGVC